MYAIKATKTYIGRPSVISWWTGRCLGAECFRQTYDHYDKALRAIVECRRHIGPKAFSNMNYWREAEIVIVPNETSNTTKSVELG